MDEQCVKKINLKEDDWARVSDGINGNGSIVSEPRYKCTMYSRFHKLSLIAPSINQPFLSRKFKNTYFDTKLNSAWILTTADCELTPLELVLKLIILTMSFFSESPTLVISLVPVSGSSLMLSKRNISPGRSPGLGSSTSGSMSYSKLSRTMIKLEMHF